MTMADYAGRYSKFRELLVEARQTRRITQVDLAKRLRRSQPFVSKYEQGIRRLDVVEFIEIAQAIGIDPKRIIRELERG